MRYKYSIVVTIVAFAAVLCSPTAGFASILESADVFAVLGSSTVSNTGSSNVTGDLGLASPGVSVVGFQVPPANTVVEQIPPSTGLIAGPGLVTGTIRIRGAVAEQARTDALAAWTGLQNMTPTSDLSGQVLGTDIPTLTSGVYNFTSSAQLTGTLTLDAQGNNNAFWVFQVGSTLTTASASSVVLSNPGLNNGVFWQIGESATLGTTTSFRGNIIADQSITLTTGADIACGRAIALNAAVTMDTNDIAANCGVGTGGTSSGFGGGLEFDKESGKVVPLPSQGPVVPEPASMLLFGLGGVAAAFIRERRKA